MMDHISSDPPEGDEWMLVFGGLFYGLSASLASLQGIFPNLKKAFELFENNKRHCEVLILLTTALWVDVVVEVPWFLLEVNYCCKYATWVICHYNNHLKPTFYLSFTYHLPIIYHLPSISPPSSPKKSCHKNVRTLNPCWGEIFELPVAKPGVPPSWPHWPPQKLTWDSWNGRKFGDFPRKRQKTPSFWGGQTMSNC